MSAGQVNPLAILRSSLASALEVGFGRVDVWEDAKADRVMVEAVRARHDGPGSPPDPATIASAVAHFRKRGEPDGWRGLKRVCFGAGARDENGWCLLADDRLRSRLLELAQSQALPRKRLKCFQSLLSSYWSFPVADADAAELAGWIALRDWLSRRMGSLSKDIGERSPGWLRTLSENANLLRDDPCGKYAQRLLSGDGTEFRSVVSSLGIPSDSWVFEEAIVSQMRAGCRFSHEKFRAALPGLLAVAMGRAGVAPSVALQSKCVAMLVVRYAKIPGTPEHPELRDAAIGVIGNPWLRRVSWDANVVDDKGRPDNAAREMVFGWLKRRLIKDFFELLSEDGAGDSRRLEYWLRFEPFVSDMWFALGNNTRWRRGDSFDDFRARAKGRLLNLEGTTSDNNAFIMRIGNYVAIEFGETGNALYLYSWEGLPVAVTNKLLSGKDRVDVAIDQLKDPEHALFKKAHRDSPVKMESWEQKFDDEICPVLGVRPNERPALISKIESLLATYKVQGEDKRPQGGALWILADDSNRAFSSKMKELGFSYRAGRGWWKE